MTSDVPSSDKSERTSLPLTRETVEVFLARSAVLYFLSDSYLNAPSSTSIEVLRSESVIDSWPLDRTHPDAAAGLDRLGRYLAGWSPEQMAILERDYTRLFIGLESTLAPPYESVYLSDEHLLFEKETLEVRSWYGRYGWQVPQLNMVPDDHIGYELHFLARLSERVSSLLEKGDVGDALAVRQDLHQFIEDHPLKWLEMFVARILEYSQTDFYVGIGNLTRVVVEQALKESVE